MTQQIVDYSVDIKSLKKAMIDVGIDTSVELAERSDLSRVTVDGVLNGKIRPSTETMYKIAGALHLDSSEAGQIFFNK